MFRLDDYPTHELNGIHYRCGRVNPFGASIIGDGIINFSVFSKNAVSCELLLYNCGEKEPYAVIPFPEEFRIGNVFSITVFGLDYEKLEYGYRFDGKYSPSEGHLFNKENILLDPYARLVGGREDWGAVSPPDEKYRYRGRVIPDDFKWEGDKQPEIPLKDLIIYEMHIRGFTRDASSGVKYKGTYAGLVEKIPYLQKLGINCIELLPIFEFDETENPRSFDGERLYNYWGYSTVSFYSPKAGYAASAHFGLAAEELKNMIKRLHKAGIEVILDVVFNHTAEGNEDGPCISFRGIDNKTYYLLTPEGYYYDFSGCGNTLNCNNAVVRNYILDCLRYWIADYHVDGFRFDLASILSRDSSGAPMSSPPLIETLAHDPVLGKAKLIAEAWDAGGLYQVGSFPAWGRWAEWNGKYRDCLRKFLKSGAECGPELITRIEGSADLYGTRSAEASINFITCHDGFTLYDLVSYNEKHNINNGEDGRDGCSSNDSWNCGAEGETDDPQINALRRRQIKNAVIILMLSRGVPMILSGDEFMNTQYGNNNAYCQDNRISWLNWEDLHTNRDVFELFCTMTSFRKAHPVLRRPDFFSGYNSSGYPELSFHGTEPWSLNRNSPFHTFAFMYAEPAADFGTEQDCFIYCAVNTYWEQRFMRLPIIPEGMVWTVLTYTGDDTLSGSTASDGISLMARSSAVLIGQRPQPPR